jgi:hypothetical protein
MTENKPERKMIATDTETGKLFEKIAKAMTRQPDQHGTVYVKDAAKVAAVEYARNHPELGVKA